MLAGSFPISVSHHATAIIFSRCIFQAMVVPEERDGKSDVASELLRDSSKAADAISSRKAGGRRDDKPPQRKVGF